MRSPEPWLMAELTHAHGQPAAPEHKAGRRRGLCGFNLAQAIPWLALSAGLWGSVACGTGHDTVFYPLSVEFESARSESLEGLGDVGINLRLNAASEDEVTVSFRVSDITASGHDACGARDYILASGDVRFEPGQTLATLELRLLDDDVHELDEQLKVELVSASGAVLGQKVVHQHTIFDDDRQLLVDVQADFGAKGDGETDDTNAIQAAVDRASLSSAAVVVWPPGVYRVRQLELPIGVNYFGYGATLLQAASQPTDAQLITFDYSGDDDSVLTLLQGLILDGNRDAQGAFSGWQYQESELVNVEGNPQRPGRLRWLAEDVTVRNTGGNGVLLGANVDASLCQLSGNDVFTDVVKLGGGHSRLSLNGLTADGSIGTTGIAIAGQAAGFDDSHALEANLNNIELLTGDLEIDVQDGSSVTMSQVSMAEPPFYLRAVRSSVSIVDSTLMMGPPLFRYNRIVAPSDVTFENTDFYLTERIEPSVSEPEADRELAVLAVTWDDVDYAFSAEETDQFVEALDGQKLTCVACRFHLASDIESSDTTYVAESVGNQGTTNTLLLRDSSVDAGFSGLFSPSCSVCSSTP